MNFAKFENMRKLRIVFCALLMLVTISCKKNIIKADKNFIGMWESAGTVAYYELTIGYSGYAIYNGYDGKNDETHTGDGKVNKRKDEFYIVKRKWKIDVYPHQVSDPVLGPVWRMTLDGIEYTRDQ